MVGIYILQLEIQSTNWQSSEPFRQLAQRSSNQKDGKHFMRFWIKKKKLIIQLNAFTFPHFFRRIHYAKHNVRGLRMEKMYRFEFMNCEWSFVIHARDKNIHLNRLLIRQNAHAVLTRCGKRNIDGTCYRYFSLSLMFSPPRRCTHRWFRSIFILFIYMWGLSPSFAFISFSIFFSFYFRHTRLARVYWTMQCHNSEFCRCSHCS